MGASRSKAVIQSLSEQITNVTIQVAQRCVVISTQKQIVNNRNTGWRIGGSANIVQATTISSNCLQDSQLITQVQNEIINVLSQSAEAKAAFGFSDADARINIENRVRNNINASVVNETLVKIEQGQEINNENLNLEIGYTLDVKQGAEAYAAAVLKTVVDSGIMNQIANTVDQEAASSGFDPSAIFASSAIIFLVIVFIVIVIAVIVFKFTPVGRVFSKIFGF